LLKRGPANIGLRNPVISEGLRRRLTIWNISEVR
jgi:hypothetical protein